MVISFFGVITIAFVSSFCRSRFYHCRLVKSLTMDAPTFMVFFVVVFQTTSVRIGCKSGSYPFLPNTPMVQDNPSVTSSITPHQIYTNNNILYIRLLTISVKLYTTQRDGNLTNIAISITGSRELESQ